MKLSTGLKKLDEKLEGGIPLGISVLLQGPPGSGKSTFCNQFIYEGNKNNEACIYVTFNASPEEIKNVAKSFGMGFSEELTIFIDAYSWQIGVKEGKYAVNPADLTNFTIKITKAITELQNKNLKRVVFDSFSTMFLFVPKDLCLRFLSMVTAKLKAFGTTQLIVIEEGMHDPSTLTAMNALTDGTIKFSSLGKIHRMEIVRMKGVTGLPVGFNFKLIETGIELEV